MQRPAHEQPGGKALAKVLFEYLSAADVEIGTLRKLGWFDFFRFEVPDTSDARVVAGAAIHSLLVSSEGTQIIHDDQILYAKLAFVQADRGGQLPTKVDRGLRSVLAFPPVEQQRVVDWFTSTFP